MSNFLVGSSNAMWRFGLIGNSVNPNSLATPKMTDMWYLELYTNSGNQTNVYSRSVKSVSEVQINVTHNSYDQYGKRIHVPQRVDFPAVTITLYDTADGKIFDLVSSIYEYGFKNNTTRTMEINSAIRDHSKSGLKSKDGISQPQNHYFTQVNIYHFGSIGQGIKHKISLSNPLVSSMSFSNHDYSSSEVRTITMTLEPENVFIDAKANPEAIPSWISQGVNRLNP
jgi:hypothetical protein